MLAVTFAVTAASGALLFQTDIGQLALLDQWERTATSGGIQLDDARYAAMADATRYGALYALLAALAGGPLLAVALSALIAWTLRPAPGHAPRYRQLLAIVAHAGVILALRQLVAAPVGYARETLGSPAALSLLFSMLDEGSAVARLLGLVDLFVIWWLIVLAIGVAALYGRPARRLAITFIGAYLVLALALAVVTAIMGGRA